MGTTTQTALSIQNDCGKKLFVLFVPLVEENLCRPFRAVMIFSARRNPGRRGVPLALGYDL